MRGGLARLLRGRLFRRPQSGKLYLGELNPRLDLDYEIDVEEINERWSHEAAVDVWSQIVIKETASSVDLITHAPRSGTYTIAPNGTADFRRPATDWHGIVRESEAFYLRILAAGDFRYKGATSVPW